MNQNDRLLAYLKRHGRITPLDAWKHLGIYRLAARVSDLKKRGFVIESGRVEVFNDRGVARLPAKVTERIMPGVVCVYQGAWYRPGPDGVDEGGCANVLTPGRTSPTGGCATHSAWVEVRSCPSGGGAE